MIQKDLNGNKNLTIEETVDRIKNKDIFLKENFINNYIPFIASVVSKVIGRYVNIHDSDEFSVGISAFNEAINSYDKSKQGCFLKFAEKVITRRVIDYLRKDNKNKRVYPFSYFEDSSTSECGNIYILEKPNNDYEKIEDSQDILMFEEKLKEFGITLNDLVNSSPKHKDSKQLCIKIAKLLCSDQGLYERFIRNKRVPIEELQGMAHVSRRTIERNRKFIIAVCLIMESDLSVIKGYLSNVT